VADGVARRFRKDEAGFALIETMLAIFVLVVGIFGVFLGFAAGQRLSLVSERHAVMVHVAQREIERLEGISYSQLALTSAPTNSSDTTNPDYYVAAGPPPTLVWNRVAGSQEQLDIDAVNGTVVPVANWTEGLYSGQVYDSVTWVTDSGCGQGCPASADYKRLTVAVTIAGGVQPGPVYSSSLIADPHATPAGGISNGLTGNPLTDPATKCTNQGVAAPCTSPIDSGNPNTYFLHDWPATSTGSPQPPSADHATRPTVGVVSGLLCTALPLLATLLNNIVGCPVPNLMDSSAPSGGSTAPLYHYSTDQCSDACYPGGSLLQPTCSNGSGCGTGSATDCSNGSWTANLLSVQSQFWVSSPLTASMTLTGEGGLSMFTQTVGSANALVSFCIELYDVPPSGSAGSLADLLAWPPVALGGAGYVPAANPQTGGNWPTSATQLSYIFNFRGSNGSVTIAAGHRLGIRIWLKASLNAAVDLLFDNPAFPTQVQLNTL
jgi:Tfp pilus assembly protein PilV